MRIARRLTLLVLTSVAAVALTVPTALAQTEPLTHTQSAELTARVEPGGTPCPAVTPSPPPAFGAIATSGGCRVHATGLNVVLISHVFGIESIDSTCNTEFDARLDAGAEGYLTHTELSQGSQGTCTRRPCGAVQPHPPSEGRAWSAYGRETAPGYKTITFLMCLWTLDGTSSTHCEVTMDLHEPTNHAYSFHTVPAGDLTRGTPCHGTTGFRGELSGQWYTEAVTGSTGEAQIEQQVEINHT